MIEIDDFVLVRFPDRTEICVVRELMENKNMILVQTSTLGAGPSMVRRDQVTEIF